MLCHASSLTCSNRGSLRGWSAVEDLHLEREPELDERVDQRVPLLVGLDHRVEVVAERDTHEAAPEEVVDLGVREAGDDPAVVVDDEVGGQSKP